MTARYAKEGWTKAVKMGERFLDRNELGTGSYLTGEVMYHDDKGVIVSPFSADHPINYAISRMYIMQDVRKWAALGETDWRWARKLLEGSKQFEPMPLP